MPGAVLIRIRKVSLPPWGKLSAELLCMAALAPLSITPLDGNTSFEVFAYDASLTGAGVTSCQLPPEVVVAELETLK